MANEKQKTAKAEETNKFEDYKIENARIIKVWTSKFDTKRISLQLDKTFTSFDEKGNFVESTDTFGIAIGAIMQQCNNEPHLSLADALAMGQPVNPQIVSLVLTGATINVDRVFKEKGEEREYEKGVYNNDCYTSKITSIKPKIADVAEKWIDRLMQTALVVKEETSATAWD